MQRIRKNMFLEDQNVLKKETAIVSLLQQQMVFFPDYATFSIWHPLSLLSFWARLVNLTMHTRWSP